MAILLTSAKRGQKNFILVISTILVIALTAIMVVVFLPEVRSGFTVVPSQEFSYLSGIKIDSDLLDSQQVIALENFENVKMIFNYVAKDQNGRQLSGQIEATTKNQAQQILGAMGLNVLTLQEQAIGRLNPFSALNQ